MEFVLKIFQVLFSFIHMSQKSINVQSSGKAGFFDHTYEGMGYRGLGLSKSFS